MNKVKFLIVIFLLLGCFEGVNAREGNLYLKEIKFLNNNYVNYNNRFNAFIESIRDENNDCEDVYNLFILGSSTVETNYKKMITSIYSNGKYYRYKVTLIWKDIPSVRSYDILGIGFYQSVRVSSNLCFKQEYCFSNGECFISKLSYPQIFSNGAGVTFKLPNGDLIFLKQTLYFDVEKNTNEKIVLQEVFGDYAHANSIIDLEEALNHKVMQYSGIVFNYNLSNYYDNIDVSKVVWRGIW